MQLRLAKMLDLLTSEGGENKIAELLLKLAKEPPPIIGMLKKKISFSLFLFRNDLAVEALEDAIIALIRQLKSKRENFPYPELEKRLLVRYSFMCLEKKFRGKNNKFNREFSRNEMQEVCEEYNFFDLKYNEEDIQDKWVIAALKTLSPREKQVLFSKEEGYKDKEIAEEMGFSSIDSVKTFRYRVVQKVKNIFSSFQI